MFKETFFILLNMSLKRTWEKEVYNLFLDLLKEKKEKFNKTFDWEKEQQENPFGTRLINDKEFWKASKLERSFVTTLGQKVFEKIALLISKDLYGHAENNFIYKSKIIKEVNQKINIIIQELNEGKSKPDWNREIAILDKVKKSSNKELEDLKVIMDLFIPKFKNSFPFYAEIKSPKPNKDQSMQTKKKLLQVYYSEDWKGEYVFLAFPYNPYGSKENYNHSHIKSIFNIYKNPKILMGKDFWDFIGGDGTYFRLLNIAKKAGENLKLLDS